jgi:hypothetical protein
MVPTWHSCGLGDSFFAKTQSERSDYDFVFAPAIAPRIRDGESDREAQAFYSALVTAPNGAAFDVASFGSALDEK